MRILIKIQRKPPLEPLDVGEVTQDYPTITPDMVITLHGSHPLINGEYEIVRDEMQMRPTAGHIDLVRVIFIRQKEENK